MAKYIPYTLEEAQANLIMWKQAFAACSTGKQYTIANRSLTRQDADECMRWINYFSDLIMKLTPGANRRSRTKQFVPWDT
ncbi:hypothetical protein AK95_14460 [Paenibacillus sp. LC231]|uniref:DUF6148 family protein n=1 Tax=Paenibacillus sp. LC231 TaxID=1120679 RepID=UPI0008DCC6A6|nr:DUF6148 family protein [Paenibacillus sp. LC231]OIB04817.1 hypothetical protein AK95_14460 [Paenibacillus sp. LC231]